ncbi:MAG: GGDEF domain-containing protein [Burkholderiales bacterium]|nr:GGDEF domain-containing protein [Burkholderiales bacterium]
MTNLLHRLDQLILGSQHKLRIRVKLTLIALYGYAVSTGVLLYGMHIDMIPPQAGRWLCAYLWIGPPVFYLLVRTGWSTRLARPGLDVPQSLYALVGILAAYVISGPVRSSVLGLMSLVLVFGMFTLNARQVMQLSAFAMLSLAAVMVAMVRAAPDQFDVRFEVIKFIVTASILPALSAVAIYIGQVRARLVEQRRELAHALDLLEDIASRDELTRLVNRRHMQLRLDQEADRQSRTGESFCLALLDLDHFKRINDQHGHNVGDLVLKEFALAGLEALRKTDVLARWGGEEFLLLLPDETLEGAQAALLRIGERLREHLANSSASALQVTFSAGLTNHPDGETLHDTLERADRALYTAKEQGRNRIVVQAALHHGATQSPLVDIPQV